MATNGCDLNQLESDFRLPPRKRLLAGFKKQNSKIGNGSPPLPSFASYSSTSNSNGSSSSSSASAVVQTHLDNLLTSPLNDHSRSPEELAQASKATAALALNVAKAARATADEKALIASKKVAAAKAALESFASFPKKNKQKKHAPVQLATTDDDLVLRFNRAINNSPRVLKNKKQKTLVTYENSGVTTSIMYNGNDVSGVVDSDSLNDDHDGTRVNGKLLLCDDNTLKEETSSSLGKRRGRVKLKKLPLSMCSSKDQENEITLAQPEGSSGAMAQVRS